MTDALNQCFRILNALDKPVLATNENGIVLFCNYQCSILLEQNSENTINKHIGDIFNLKVLKKNNFNIENIKSFAENNKPRINFKLKYGKLKYLEISIKIELLNTTPILLLLINDITDEINCINNSEKNHKSIEKLNTSLKSILSIIAHDLRTPFAQVYSFIELLTDIPEEELFDTAKDILPMLKNSAKNGLSLIDSIVQLGKAISNRIVVNRTEFNICELIVEVIDSQKNISKLKNIEIVTFFENNNIQVFADRNMIKTVLANTINNAIKYSYLKSKIYVKAELYNLFCKIEITDFGVGLNEDQIKKLFDISKHEVRNGTDNEKGWGFGLLVAKEFLKLNSGNIWVESIPSTKTSFYFTVLSKIKLSQNQNNSNKLLF